MKRLTVLTIALGIILMCGVTQAVTTNMEGLVYTPFPHWHYFDTYTNENFGFRISELPFYVSGPLNENTDAAGPNRGNGTTARKFTFEDATGKLVLKYDVSSLGDSAYYILQIDNNYKIEFSSNNTDWVFISTNTAPYSDPANQETLWQNKPVTNEAPYTFDISSYLPANYFYVRIGDASTANGWGGIAWNALITKFGYPYFHGGGGEPDAQAYAGDQQYIYYKGGAPELDWTRYADGHAFFLYKFDLPDGDDTCYLHAKVAGEYVMRIGRSPFGSTWDYVSSNNPGVTAGVDLNIDLSSILSQTADNVIYVRMSDSDTSNGNGGQAHDFWISSQPNTTEDVTFIPVSEEETQYLWDNHAFLTAAHQRFTDGTAHLTYRVNFDPAGSIDMAVANEYVIEVSTDDATWTSIFNAGSGATSLENISYNPFTGDTTGVGATGNHPVLCPNWVDGQTNVLYVRVSDANTSTGNGGLVQSVSINIIPEPTLLIGGLLLGLAFLRRK